MDLDTVRIFVDVMKFGSFAAVARQRDIDPSSVSRSIAALEGELGFRLFQRTTRKLAPTEAGKLYNERVEGLIEDFDRAGKQAQDLVSQPKGNLRISACTSFGPRVLAPLLPKIRKNYPDLTFELLLVDHQVDIIDEQIDLAIRFGLRPKGDFVASKLSPRNFWHLCKPVFFTIAWQALNAGRSVGFGMHGVFGARLPKFLDVSRTRRRNLHGANLGPLADLTWNDHDGLCRQRVGCCYAAGLALR